jgi:hypothetical protein
VIYYTYSVGRASFTGHGQREYRDARYERVGIGARTVVWYSASHPWISTSRRPDATLYGLPWLVVVLLLDFAMIWGLVDRWRDGRKDRESTRR